MNTPHIFTILHSVAKQLAEGVHVGSQFAFLDLEAIGDGNVPLPSSLHPALQDSSDSAEMIQTRLTVPLALGEKLSLPGVNVKAAPLPALSLRSLTCDRDLYRCGNDVVNLLVVDLDAPNSDATVNLLLGTAATSRLEFDSRTVPLNENGLGLARFEDLPIGQYQVIHADSPRPNGGCEFTVAGFELAPLVATLGQMQLRQNSLACTLHVSHFDKPLNGQIRVDLLEDKNRVDSRWTTAKQGLAMVALEIEGDGPHHLEITMVDDASATATIPLPGSQKQQRKETVLTSCGLTTTASLIAGHDTSEVLGLHVRQTEQDNAPIRLHDDLRGSIRMEVMQDIEDCCVCTSPFPSAAERTDGTSVPASPTAHQRLGNLSAGQVVQVETSDLVGLFSIAGFVGKQPWEARAVTLRRSTLQASLHISAPAAQRSLQAPAEDTFFEPSSEVSVHIDMGNEGNGHAAVIIRDARLQPSRRPQQQLAANIKMTAAEADPGTVDIQSIYGAPTSSSVYRQWNDYSNKFPSIDNETLVKLVDRGVISDPQADHVMESSTECGRPYYSLILENGYAVAEDIAEALADIYGYEFIDLDNASIEPTLMELCPESVARENTVIPIRQDLDGKLVFAMANPIDLEMIEKLRFILNRRIEMVIATPDAIFQAINLYFGQVEGESADSMLQVFTDTAIDFCETLDVVPSRASKNPSLSQSDSMENSLSAKSIVEDAEVIFSDLLECQAGQSQVAVVLPKRLGRYTVDAFVVSKGQWSHAEVHFEVNADPYVKLQVPKILFDGDQANGRVVARCQSGDFSLNVCCDGVPVTLHQTLEPYDATSTENLTTKEATFGFVVGQGEYTAEVCDRQTGRIRRDTQCVHPLGELVQPRRTLRLISPGETIELTDQIRRIRLLPNIQPIQQMVAEATADYNHLCCEQTAAKLFSAVVCLANQLASGEPIETTTSAIRVGLKRQRMMWLPGRGFATYPGQSPVDAWGRMATSHLLKTEFIREILESDPTAMALLGEIRQLADIAAKHYKMAWPPMSINDCEDAYAQLRFGHGDPKRALDYLRAQIRPTRVGVRSFWRARQAMAIAGLLRGAQANDLLIATQRANELFDQLGPEGRLYSTVDSVALVVLLLELSRQEWLRPGSQICINGQPLTAAAALASQMPIRTLRSEGNTCAVECLSYATENWAEFESNTPISVSLSAGGQFLQAFSEGAAVDLHVRIKKGYQAGDLIWVALPPCLSRIHGGGQVKQFAVDLEGASETTIRLAATARSQHPTCSPTNQHFLVCLRNMYDEERIGNPGPLPVQVLG